jgi:hypothetical protein
MAAGLTLTRVKTSETGSLFVPAPEPVSIVFFASDTFNAEFVTDEELNYKTKLRIINDVIN